MKFDIDKMTEAELIDLNRRIVERLRFLDQMKAHSTMLEFRLGDRVKFQPENRPLVVGIITKYNRKTVTVISEDRIQWNVSPTLLSAADSVESNEVTNRNVIELKR